ncbi:MAG TPA: class I SAM-dependent methyltransferase [Candidatus Thermoplasmatota archaeon]|nr:class I SAM-dependent methyltransferase [Candidatus Thermoplasmatota archaeon]
MTQQYFDEVAPAWETMRRGFFPESLKVRAADAMPVRRGASYLDVGAGSGFIAREVLARGGDVLALDASLRMVDELTRQGIDARVGQAERLQFADASFDGAFANMCLHHVERPAVAVREMARVVRPGGRVVITDLDSHAHEFLRAEHHDRWMGFERADVAAWLRDAGLVDASVVDARSDCCADSECGTEKAEISIFLASATKSS